LDEAIKHVSEAHFRACWMETASVKTFSELKKKSPQDLKTLAGEILRKHASREAIHKIESLPDDKQDHILKQWTMWNTDVLAYLELRDAIKIGDVGRMEDLVPTLLFRFAGGGNSKYAIEMLELLQGLRKEWPVEIKNFIREWCWLMNRTGKRDGFLPFDLGQEENIADIKVNYRSMGPGATMDYIQKVSPAIPTLRGVQRHMEDQFKSLTRGARHGVPQKEDDVGKLTAQYMKSGIHKFVAGRKIHNSPDKAPDFLTMGAINLEKLGTIDKWFTQRTHARAMGENWD
ncbi:hypothetical protein K443DRAFT_61464, partial [Laccaria amethystina LaAM-08-1]